MVGTFVFFSWWRDLNARCAAWPPSWRWGLILATALAGLLARLWASRFPYNYDFTAYVAVSDTVLGGGNPYETGKHNYGPIWFLIHSTIRRFLEEPDAFRLGLALLFALVDIAIALLLMRRGYLAGAALFLLAPVGIAISGQHGQFDNIAIALALAAALAFRRGGSEIRIGSSDLLSVMLLGLSLSTKHDFLVLPLWFALMQGSWLRRATYAVVPYAIFGLSLLPYWVINSAPVRDYVLSYRSNPNAPAYYLLLPDEIVWGWVNRGFIAVIFLLLMFALGWYYRRLPAFEVTLIYGITLVVFSPAIVDQYFAIPMPGIAAFLNLGFLAWMVFVSIYLLGEPEDFNLPIFNTMKLHLAPYQEGTYKDQFVFLFVGWLIMNVWLRREGWIRGDPRQLNPGVQDVREAPKPAGGVQ